MLKTIVRFFNLVNIGMVYLAKAMIIAMVLITFSNVVLRYGFNSGIIWSEEVSLLLAVWFIFIAMGLGVKQRLHISISLFDAARIPKWLDKALLRLRDIVLIVVGIVMLRSGASLTEITMKSIMPATQWPAGLLYAVLPVSSVVILYEAVTNLFGVDKNNGPVDDFLSGKGSFADAMGAKHD
jgi:TRAP-type transport system small permease protein